MDTTGQTQAARCQAGAYIIRLTTVSLAWKKMSVFGASLPVASGGKGYSSLISTFLLIYRTQG